MPRKSSTGLTSSPKDCVRSVHLAVKKCGSKHKTAQLLSMEWLASSNLVQELSEPLLEIGWDP